MTSEMLAVRRGKGRGLPVVWIAVLTMTLLAAVDALVGKDLVLAGVIAVGPCIAATTAGPRVVAALGAYACVLISFLAWWPDDFWGTRQHLVYIAATVAVTAISADVSRRHRALETSVAASDHRNRMLALLVDSSDEAIICTSIGGIVESWNIGAVRLFGYTADEVIGVSARLLAVSGDFSQQTSMIERLRSGERSIRYEARRTRSDGSIVDLAIAASPMLDEAGVVVGVSSVMRDLTEAKAMDAERTVLQDRTSQSERLTSLGQLAGGIAHDFNNLLGIILNCTAFAAEASTADSSVIEDLTQVRIAAERAAELTRQLLVFTRQDSARMAILDLNDSLAEAEALLGRTIGEHIELSVVPSRVPLTISANPGHIQQVLVNLAVNARDAMPGGGKLRISGGIKEVESNQAGLDPQPEPGTYAQLSVTDTGVGMSPEVAARIFEPFYTTKPVGQGTGLGMATVYGIVARSGGAINVYSEPGLGTTVRLYFPIVAATGHRADVQRVTRRPADGSGRRILVVEDERALADVVMRVLVEGGYSVQVANSAREALVLDEAIPCDLLLTDVVMPEMSGPQLAEVLLARRPSLPVVMMSGYSDGVLQPSSAERLGGRILEKPFSGDELLREVESALADAPASA